MEVVNLLLHVPAVSSCDSPSSIRNIQGTNIIYDDQDAFGLIPFLCSIYGGHQDVILLLSNHGASESLHDGYGRSALNSAAISPLLTDALKARVSLVIFPRQDNRELRSGD